MVLVAYDFVGTFLADGCCEERACTTRRGFTACLRRQKELGWAAVLFSDLDRADEDDILARTGLEGAFAASFARDSLDSEGLPALSLLPRRHAWTVFVSGMATGPKAAEKYGISSVRVPRHESGEDAFDFGLVEELLEALALDKFAEYAALHSLKESRPELHAREYADSGMWVRVTPERFAAQFY